MLFRDFFSDAEAAWPEPADSDAVQERISPFLHRLHEAERSFCETLLHQVTKEWTSQSTKKASEAEASEAFDLEKK